MSEAVKIVEALWDTHRQSLLAVRTKVFVEEQNVPASMEVDEYDEVSIHVLALDPDDNPIGTARLLPAGKIGRVAVLKEWRKSGVGRAMMIRLIEIAKQRGDTELILHAQTWTIPFYRSLGFTAEGDEFDEAGIPHRKMRRIPV
ncbi:MAG: GNAT family N-acetyltransferase [Verrucomicrobiales bacterium]|nr:GNAT family N-acetyltransferase [Verrucomicrobiales bacterium]